MRRGLFTFASVLSLLLCVATVMLWLRGRDDAFYDLELRSTEPSCGIRLSDKGLIVWVQSEDSLSRNPDATGDISDGFAGFWYLRDSDHSNARVWNLTIPYWFIVLACAAMPLIWGFTRRRRRHADCCPTCHYNLTGNISGICPECGTSVVGKIGAVA